MPELISDKNETAKTDINLFKKKQVLKAISVVKSLNKKFVDEELKKIPLLDETSESPVFLQLTLKKIPVVRLLQMIKISLPHPLTTETTDVCLFTGDLDKHNKKAEIEPDVLHYKDLLKKHGVTKVSEVITLRQLRTEYKTYESKRQLVAAYGVFLADKKIAGCLPRVLGKFFFQKRKVPFQINMNSSNLKDQIEKALAKTEFSVTCRGNTCAFEVARLSMDDKAILENIMASVKVVADKIPGNLNNLLGVYLKTAKSKAIPIYVSFESPNDLTFKKKKKSERVKVEELSTMSNVGVKVFRDGRITVTKIKENLNETKTIIEVGNDNTLSQSLQLNDSPLENEEALEDEHVNKSPTKKKTKKGIKENETVNVVEVSKETQTSVKSKKGKLKENGEGVEDSHVNESPNKKKGKKNIQSNRAEDIENSEETGTFLEQSKKRKLKENYVTSEKKKQKLNKNANLTISGMENEINFEEKSSEKSKKHVSSENEDIAEKEIVLKSKKTKKTLKEGLEDSAIVKTPLQLKKKIIPDEEVDKVKVNSASKTNKATPFEKCVGDARANPSKSKRSKNVIKEIMETTENGDQMEVSLKSIKDKVIGHKKKDSSCQCSNTFQI